MTVTSSSGIRFDIDQPARVERAVDLVKDASKEIRLLMKLAYFIVLRCGRGDGPLGTSVSKKILMLFRDVMSMSTPQCRTLLSQAIRCIVLDWGQVLGASLLLSLETELVASLMTAGGTRISGLVCCDALLAIRVLSSRGSGLSFSESNWMLSYMISSMEACGCPVELKTFFEYFIKLLKSDRGEKLLASVTMRICVPPCLLPGPLDCSALISVRLRSLLILIPIFGKDREWVDDICKLEFPADFDDFLLVGRVVSAALDNSTVHLCFLLNRYPATTQGLWKLVQEGIGAPEVEEILQSARLISAHIDWRISAPFLEYTLRLLRKHTTAEVEGFGCEVVRAGSKKRQSRETQILLFKIACEVQLKQLVLDSQSSAMMSCLDAMGEFPVAVGDSFLSAQKSLGSTVCTVSELDRFFAEEEPPSKSQEKHWFCGLETITVFESILEIPNRPPLLIKRGSVRTAPAFLSLHCDEINFDAPPKLADLRKFS